MKHTNIKCLAVDGDIVCFRVAAVHEMSTLPELHKAIDEYIFEITRNSEVNDMAMFLSDSTNFRYDIAKTVPYKHNRYDKNGNPKVIKPRYLANAKEYLKKQYQAYIEFDHEADDCIASFMTLNEDVAHAGIDKDIRQVVGWHFNFVKNEWTHTNEDESELLLWRQVCTGDYGDGIPGLSGIGPAKAAAAVTSPENARLQAFELYCERLKDTMSEPQIYEYFTEQTKLIRMVDSLVISWEHVVTINPPNIVEPDLEDGDSFMGFDLDLED